MSQEFIFKGSGTASVEPGESSGTLEFEFPVPHGLFWGQRVEQFVRKKEFVETTGVFDLTARFWRSGEISLDLTSRLDSGEVEGDSFLVPRDGVAIKCLIPPHEYDVQLVVNNKGRVAGFDLKSIMTPTASDALRASEMILSQFERAAALSGVPLFCPLLKIVRPDRSEARMSMLLPFPDVTMRNPTRSALPAIEILADTFAEGRRSSSVFYRALVFFKIVDTFLEKIQPELNRITRKLGMPFQPLELVFPEDPFRQISASLIGVKYTSYRDAVRGRIRDVVAHLDPSAPIAPFSTIAEIEVQTASIALNYCAGEIMEFFAKSLDAIGKVNIAEAIGFTYEPIDKRRKRNEKRAKEARTVGSSDE